jgi:hypothetical protein
VTEAPIELGAAKAAGMEGAVRSRREAALKKALSD